MIQNLKSRPLRKGGAPGLPRQRWPLTPARFFDRRVQILALIFLLAVGLRTLAYVQTPRPLDGAGLAAEQAEMARNIVDHGRWFVVNTRAYDLVKQRQAEEGRLVDPSRVDFSNVDRRPSYIDEVQQMPGPALVIASLWWMTGVHTYSLLLWMQILIDSSMVLVVYWIAYRLTRRRSVAMFAAFLYAIWIGAIVTAVRPVADTWATFFFISSVGVFVWARERPDLRRLAPFGILVGLGVYFRPFVVLLAVVLGIAGAPGGGWRRRLLWSAVPTAIALVILSPWTIRNYFEFHRFIPTRTGLGQAVFEGAGGASTDQAAAKVVREKDKSARYGTPKYDDFLLRAAWRRIAHDPGSYARSVLNRARYLLPCLLLLFVWRRWRAEALLLATVAIAIIGPYLLIGDDTRFYLPAAFTYLILMSMTVSVVMSQLGGHLARTILSSSSRSGS